MTIETLNADGGSVWTNPADAASTNTTYASTSSDPSTCDFTLDASAILDADTVNTVTIKVIGSRTGGDTKDYFDIGLVVGGVLQGLVQRTAALSSTDTTYTLTDAVNWDIDWTAAQMDGMAIRVTSIQTGMGFSAVWRVDHAYVEVDYTAAPSLTHYTIACDPTTYSLTGTAVTNAVTRALSLDPDTYTLTGTALTTKVTRLLSLVPDIHRVVGSNASLFATNSEFDLKVRDNELVTSVARTSNTVVTITLSAAATYDISSQESITATIPSDALVTGTVDVVASPSFTIDIAAALNHYTLDPTAGTYSLSGTSATVLANRLLSLDPDTYALTGTAATLIADKVLSLDSNNYSLTGSSATFSINRALDLDSNTYNLSGTSATLTTDRVITANPTTHTVTGVSATLAKGGDKALNLDPEICRVTGSNASLFITNSEFDREVRNNELVTSVVRTSNTVVTITLSASAGYDIAAQETITATIPSDALTTGTVDVIASPSFTIDFAATLNHYTLTLETGTFTLTGTAATLNTARDLVADPDSYLSTGTSSTLTVNRSLSLDPDTYTLSGVSNTFTRALTLAADPSTYTVTGANATLSSTSASEWNTEVRDKEVVTSVVRTSDTIVTITLSASALYDITAQEIITATIPATALVTSTIDHDAAPTFTVDFVNANYGLAADPTTYSVTGSDSNYTISRVLTADSDSYTLTGINATLSSTRALAADSINYTSTGSVIDFAIARKLKADTGTYTKAGYTATLVSTAVLRIRAYPGTFNVIGSDALLAKYNTIYSTGLTSQYGGDIGLTGDGLAGDGIASHNTGNSSINSTGRTGSGIKSNQSTGSRLTGTGRL